MVALAHTVRVIEVRRVLVSDVPSYEVEGWKACLNQDGTLASTPIHGGLVGVALVTRPAGTRCCAEVYCGCNLALRGGPEVLGAHGDGEQSLRDVAGDPRGRVSSPHGAGGTGREDVTAGRDPRFSIEGRP